jgi:hypothetical protein
MDMRLCHDKEAVHIVDMRLCHDTG